MKNQKGVTLISLTIYIIAMTIVIAVIAVISNYFYNNAHSLSDTINPISEYTKFNSFFSNEVNHNNIKILECNENYVVFDNGVQYRYLSENKGIYRDQVKIARDVKSCKFERKIKNGKDVVTVTIEIEKAQSKTVDYTLKN